MAAAPGQGVFVMHGARAAIAGGLTHIEEQVTALELAVADNTGLAFDLARTLIESACKTVLAERGSTFDRDEKLPNLFREATRTVPFLPTTLAGDAGARRSLLQTLNGLKTALQGVCELRNAFGFASHGSDKLRPAMEDIQALLAAQAADAIVGFLYRVHRQDWSRLRTLSLEYDDHPEFNEWIDEQNEPMRIFSLPPYRPSEVLFEIDREAYRDLRTDYKSEALGEEDEVAA